MLRICSAPTCLLLLAAMIFIPSCGSGTLADIWEKFPASAFEDETDDGDGGDRPGIPGGFEPLEVAFLDVAQGVEGDVRNIEVAVVGAQALAFLSADSEGLHVIDVTTPEVLPSSALLGTVPGSNFCIVKLRLNAIILGARFQHRVEIVQIVLLVRLQAPRIVVNYLFQCGATVSNFE